MSILAKYKSMRAEALSRVRRVGVSTTSGRSSGSPTPDSMAAMMRSSSRFGQYGVDAGQNLEQYRHFAGYTYSLIRTIANRVAAQPIHHARKLPKGKTPQKSWQKATKASVPPFLKNRFESLKVFDESVILKAFDNPNPVMVRYILLYNLVVSMECTGKHLWWMLWDDSPKDSIEARVPQIWPFPSHWFEPVHTDERLFDHWMVRPGGSGEAVPIPNEEVVYFYYPDPSDPLSAYSPLSALAKTVMADESIEETHRRAFLNAVNPGVAVMVGQLPEASGVGAAGTTPVLTRSQRKSLKTILMEEYRGTLNHGMPLILDGFLKDIKRIDLPPNEFDFMNSGEVTRSRLGQGWGVGKASMGENENSNRASSAVSDDHLCKNTINPRLQLFSEVMSCTMPKFYTGATDEVVYFEPAHSEDIEFDLSMEEAMVDRGAMSLNQWLAAHGKPKIKNGDRALVGGQWEEVIEETVDDKKRQRPSGIKSLAKAMGFKAVAEHTMEMTLDHERKMLDILKDAFMALGREAADKIDKMTPDQVTERSVAGSIDRHHWMKVLRELLTPAIANAAYAGAVSEWVLHRTTNNPKRHLHKDTRNSLPHKVAKKVGEFVRDLTDSSMWSRMVNGVIRAAVSAVKTARKEGLNLAVAAMTVLSGEQAILERSAAIAQMEAQTAVYAGQTEAFKTLSAAGAVGTRTWVTKHDNRVRPSHQQAEGQKVIGSQKFKIGGHECDFPGDPNLPPEERFGCRCVVVSS